MIIEQDISEIAVGTYVVDIVQQRGEYHLASSDWVRNDAVINKLKSKGIKRLLVDTSKFKQTSFQDEIIQAQAIVNESKVVLKKLFDNAKNGILIDLAPVKDITDQSIEVIFKNPDALACVINIRQKDEYLLEHSIAVSILITIFALHMSIDKETVKALSIGAFLHDVGKTKIPDEILNKQGKLTEEEFQLIKGHVNYSIDMIQDTPGISDLSLEVVALHHEKLNGHGYPLGESDKRISVYGRMVAICDIFDALTANRCYKNSYHQVKAFRILRRLSKENHLDPILVDSFIQCMGVYPVGSLVELNNNRLAIVESRNKEEPTKPKVKTFYSLNQKSFEMSQEVNLSTVKGVQIVKCIRVDDFDINLRQIIDFLANENNTISGN